MTIKKISENVKNGILLTEKQFYRWVKARKIKNIIWSKKHYDIDEEKDEVIDEYWSVYADGIKVFVEG